MSRLFKLVCALVGLLLVGVAFSFFTQPSSSKISFIATSTVVAATATTTATSTMQVATSTMGIDSSVTLEQKVGQMLIVGFRGMNATGSSPIVHDINDLNLGGIILFDYDAPTGKYVRNVSTKAQVVKLISDIKRYTNKNIFVSVDLEGGAVNRLKARYGFVNFPSAQTLGNAGDLTATQKDGAAIGAELAATGFNMDFAPDVDVNVNPKNPVIGAVGRSFSSDPNQVIAEATAFLAGLHSQNIIGVIKHFPGHGSSATDSHLGFVDITKTYQQKELLPFKAFSNSADAVMVAHVTNTNIDPNYPASLSPLFIQNILRGDLGYKGVVISDDISMGAISKNYTLTDAVIRAVNAGNDMLIVSNNGGSVYDEKLPYKVDAIIVQAVKDGKIPEATIDAAYVRIQNLKKNFNI